MVQRDTQMWALSQCSPDTLGWKELCVTRGDVREKSMMVHSGWIDTIWNALWLPEGVTQPVGPSRQHHFLYEVLVRKDVYGDGPLLVQRFFFFILKLHCEFTGLKICITVPFILSFWRKSKIEKFPFLPNELVWCLYIFFFLLNISADLSWFSGSCWNIALLLFQASFAKTWTDSLLFSNFSLAYCKMLQRRKPSSAFKLFYVYSCFFSAWLFLHHLGAWSHRGQKRGSSSAGITDGVSHLMDGGNWTKSSGKSSHCSELLIREC